MKHLLLILFTALSLLPVAEKSRAATEDQMVNAVISKVFTETEKRILNHYYGRKNQENEPRQYQGHNKKAKDAKASRDIKDKNNKALPPGLARKTSLPPGLARQLTEKGTPPPGLATRDLPADLSSRLPPRKGTRRVIVDNDILLIEQGTDLVLDILEDILTGTN